MTEPTLAATATQPQPAAAQPQDFEGHNIKGGQVQKTWGEWITRADISPVQARYVDSITPKEEPAPEAPKANWRTPFTWVANVFKTIGTAISDGIKAFFGICGFCKAEEAIPPVEEAGAESQEEADAVQEN